MKNLISIWLICGFSYHGFNQTREWFSLPETINGTIRCLTEYDSKLIVGGSTITQAGPVSTNGLAAWNGSWSSLGTGIMMEGASGYILDMVVHHDSLYVVGNFDQAGGISANDIAVWDGSNWTAMGTGSNNYIRAIEVYNDEIYVAGTFDTISGIAARGIAKWNGTNWENLGKGLRYNTTNQEVSELCVFQNTLFATGSIDSAGNIACDDVAFWDGADWFTIPSTIPAGIPGMIEWNGSILFGSPSVDIGSDLLVEVHAWDNIDYYTFSYQWSTSAIYHFEIFEGDLYGGGNNFGYDFGNTVRIWDGTEWTPAGTGIGDGVNALCIYNGDLYAGGSFNTSTGSQHNRLARYAELNSINENATNSFFQIYPNPTNSIATLQFDLIENSEVEIAIVDLQGRIIKSFDKKNLEFGAQTIPLDLNDLAVGIYFVQINIGGEFYFEKLVKE